MQKILSSEEINKFKEDGAIFLKGKFDINWIKKLQKGIERDIKNPSPRFKSHTIEKDVPAYLEDYWTWDFIPEFKDFVFMFCSIIVTQNVFEPLFFLFFFLFSQSKFKNIFLESKKSSFALMIYYIIYYLVAVTDIAYKIKLY